MILKLVKNFSFCFVFQLTTTLKQQSLLRYSLYNYNLVLPLINFFFRDVILDFSLTTWIAVPLTVSCELKFKNQTPKRRRRRSRTGQKKRIIHFVCYRVVHLWRFMSASREGHFGTLFFLFLSLFIYLLQKRGKLLGFFFFLSFFVTRVKPIGDELLEEGEYKPFALFCMKGRKHPLSISPFLC